MRDPLGTVCLGACNERDRHVRPGTRGWENGEHLSSKFNQTHPSGASARSSCSILSHKLALIVKELVRYGQTRRAAALLKKTGCVRFVQHSLSYVMTINTHLVRLLHKECA